MYCLSSPNLHGGEHAERTRFVSASAIPIHQTIAKNNLPVHAHSLAIGGLQGPAGKHNATEPKKSGHKTTIEIPSQLSPYAFPHTVETTYSVERWNYSFGHTAAKTTTYPGHAAGRKHNVRAKHTTEPYPFTGGYGPNLFEEVERYAQAVAEIAHRHSFDVIHAHDWMTFEAGIAAKQISGKPLIAHVHATEIDRSGAHVNPHVFQIEKRGMALADKVVAVSQWTKNIAIENYDIPAENIEVVHNGIDPKQSADLSALSLPLDSGVVTFMGRITRQKGPMYFVEAARKVHERFPDTHFVVAGSGDQLPIMIERIAQLRLSKHFHFTGFLRGNDIDRIWAISNVYVMPSVSEPFGIAPLEAIQAGVPVILSKQAGVSEVMPHAIKVNFWDSDAFAEAICNVLRFKSLADTLKKNGSEEMKNITWDKAAKKLTTLYHDFTAKHNKRKKSDPLFPSTSTKKTSHTAVL